MNDQEPEQRETRNVTFLEPPKQKKWWTNLRSNFLTGFVVFAPISITIYLVWTFAEFVDARVLPLVPIVYKLEDYLPISLPGLGVVVFFFIVAGLGALTKGLFGRQIFRIGEGFVDRMPVVRSIYNALKQIVETIFAQGGKDSFDKVCMIQYPREGIWALAFISTDTTGEVLSRSGEDAMMSVFLPTTPNPTSGFLLFLPARDVVVLDMSVEDAAKLIISAGLVTPPWDTAAPGEATMPEAGTGSRGHSSLSAENGREEVRNPPYLDVPENAYNPQIP